MDDSWGRFVASCSAAPDAKPIRTEYEYPLPADLFDSVNKHISDLIKNAAYPYDQHLYPVSSQFDLAFVQALYGQGPHFLVATKI
jgi:hypothetical protein